tara:strand:- start:2030 stop:3424 length:1395 start_codon:yes stop_codon:yes gene_type:complete
MKNINWDDIIAEWSYRLPKGFPTMKNGKFTVKSELKVLQEVLAENGINEMPDFTKKAPTRVREAEEPTQAMEMTKEQLIAALSDPKVNISPKTIATIKKLIGRNADYEIAITDAIKVSLKGDSSHADEIVDILLQEDTDQSALHTYLLNRETDGVDYTEFEGTPMKVADLFRKTGLSASTLGNLGMYRWSATPQLGTVEVLLAVLLKGGARPTKSGDLVVNGQVFEVGGFNKRLRSQKGLGTAEDVQEGFKAGYRTLAESKNLIMSTFVSPSGGAKPATSPTFKVIEDNARYGSSMDVGWITALQDMNKQLIELTKDEDPVTKEELITAMAAGFSRGLIEKKSPNDWMWIKNFLKDDGTFSIRPFLIDFACVYLDYYMDLEGGGNIFIVTDSSGATKPPVSKENISLLAFPANGAGLKPHLYKTIGLGIPNYMKKSGIQGVTFALRLGKISEKGGDSLDENWDY